MQIRKGEVKLFLLTATLFFMYKILRKLKITMYQKLFSQLLKIQDQYTIVNCISNTSNKQSENKIKNIISFTVVPKRIRYLGISSTKKCSVHIEMCRTMLRKIKNHLNKWTDIPYSCIRKLNLHQIPTGVFVETHKLVIKCVWKYKVSGVAKYIINEKQLVDFHLFSNIIMKLQ